MVDNEDIKPSVIERLSKGRYGASLSVLQRVAQPTFTPARIVTNNPNRIQLTIQNIGEVDVRISIQHVLSINDTILIPSWGGTITFTIDEDGEICGYEIYARTAFENGRVIIIEVIAL